MIRKRCEHGGVRAESAVNDLIEHVRVDDECVCLPTISAVFRDDGGNDWNYIHHRLDTFLRGPA